MNDLEPILPRDAVARFLERRKADSTKETISSYGYRLKQFVEWCEHDAGLMNLNDVTGRDLQEYWSYRRPSLGDVSIQNEFGTLKKFFEFGVAIEAVEPAMPDKADILKPTLSKEEQANDLKLPPERAEEILRYLEKFRYATREHALFAFAWHTAARISGMRSLDVEDFEPEGADGEPVRESVSFHHRKSSETPLKNKRKSERGNALSTPVADVLRDYIRENRLEQLDDYGRRPLFTTERGRIAKTTIRRTFYLLTQPCFVGGCPHEKDPQECEWLEHGRASRCPSSMSPHRVRTGSISHMRERSIPIDDVSERVDATPETIRDHYDRSDEAKRMEQRRKHVEKIDF